MDLEPLLRAILRGGEPGIEFQPRRVRFDQKVGRSFLHRGEQLLTRGRIRDLLCNGAENTKLRFDCLRLFFRNEKRLE